MNVSGRMPVRGVIIALLIVLAQPGLAAEVDTSTVAMAALEPLEEFPDLVSALSLVLVPKLLADGVVLKAFVSSKEFAGARERWGDAFAVDVLFRRAQNLCWGNTFCALLTTFLAVVDHRRVGVRTPVPGLVLWFPLTGEFPDEHALRLQGLPRRVTADSPGAEGGDRDKLQHFFGSALLAISPSPEIRSTVSGNLLNGEKSGSSWAACLISATSRPTAGAGASGYACLKIPLCGPQSFCWCHCGSRWMHSGFTPVRRFHHEDRPRCR